MAKGSGPDKRIVVTPRMLRAGALALAALGDVSDYEVVGTVYRAMAAVAPQQTKSAEHMPPANFLEVMRLMRSGRRDV
jgi:cytochrome c-type biogenesis protein CcmH/NrfG